MKKETMTLELKQRMGDSTTPCYLHNVVAITDNTEFGDRYFSITDFERRILELDTFEYIKDCKTGKLYVENGKWVAKSDKPIIFPKENFRREVRNGVVFMVCTLRQKAMQTIGLWLGKPNGKTYFRNGKKYYKPNQNCYIGNDKDLNKLVNADYMSFEESIIEGKPYKKYQFTRKGLDWLGDQLGMIIKDVK